MIFWIYSKIEKCCCSRKKRDENVVPSSNLPWLWIGATYDNGNVKDCTEEVNKVVTYGMHINTRLLNFIISDDRPVSWKYLDTKTLEYKEFPSTGLVIDEY